MLKMPIGICFRFPHIAVLVFMVLLDGCVTRYSIEEHKSYSVKGNASIVGTIVGEWDYNYVYLLPATTHGLALEDWSVDDMLEGDIRCKMDKRYLDLVKTSTIEDGAFLFKDLPPGTYLLKAELVGHRWWSPETTFGSLNAGGSLTVDLPNGTFTRDSSGKWSPPGVMQSFKKNITKKFTLNDGELQEAVLP